jgi:predicted GH43/DUF377 family glycosyl hydrolase
MNFQVVRRNIRFTPDASRVIARFLFTSENRSVNIIRNVLAMSEDNVNVALGQVLRDYSRRHRSISKIFEKHFNKITPIFERFSIDPKTLTMSQKVLIGSYFTMEYSIESAAFFNPSMVEHPDQSELGRGDKRVIISFRATGEGHISSIVFRSGILDKNNNLTLDPPGKMLEEAEHIRRHVYDKKAFRSKLDEMQDFHTIIPPEIILDLLGDNFTYGELRAVIHEARTRSEHLAADKEMLFNQMMWLASSHYELDFSLDTALSERVIFPISITEKNGIEDARFVKFVDTGGEATYYATYTAYDGLRILPKLIKTRDFYHFEILPINGEIAQNKGMALFPRKVGGKYAMLCRIDGVNNFISFSDNINLWREAKIIQRPKYPWEFVQIGNCGSPIETKEGWLIITHGVGAMREYVLGASLFDLEKPDIEIGRLKTPLLIPNADEREGYVPNVVYSCGSIVHNEDLVIPYAVSDYASTYATINLNNLLKEIKNS